MIAGAIGQMSRYIDTAEWENMRHSSFAYTSFVLVEMTRTV